VYAGLRKRKAGAQILAPDDENATKRGSKYDDKRDIIDRRSVAGKFSSSRM